MGVFIPIFGTGFELGRIPYRPGVMETNSNGSSIRVDSPGHTGNYALYWEQTGNGTVWYWQYNLPTPRKDLAFGVWSQYTVLSGNPERGIQFNVAGNNIRLYPQLPAAPTGRYDLQINGATVATGSILFNASAWHNVQILLDLNGSGSIQVMIDGALDINYSTNINANITAIYLHAGFQTVTSTIWHLDDLVVGYGGWPGDLRGEVMYPDADTATHDWVPNGTSMQLTPAAPTVALGAAAGLTGDYRYKVTLVDPGGETLASVASSLVQPVNQKIDLSNIPTGLTDWTTARKIYRTVAGGSVYKLCATIGDNTTTTYTDSLVDGSLGANEPANVHYTQIDERPPSDGDYILTAVDNASDLHELSDWQEDAKIVKFVSQWARARKTTADLQQLEMLMKAGGVLSESSPFPLSTGFLDYYRLMALHPSGSGWVNTDFDTLQIGSKRIVP